MWLKSGECYVQFIVDITIISLKIIILKNKTAVLVKSG